MTIFGIDVARYQKGLDLGDVKEAGYEFVVAKATEGRGWQDPVFHEWKKSAQDHGLLFAAYHFLRSDSSAVEQAENVARFVGDRTIPIVIDAETGTNGSKPTMAHIRDFGHALTALGYKVSLLYLPKWYWETIGQPPLVGWDIWQSSYGANNGEYHGDTSTRWDWPGANVQVLQYTSKGRIPGYTGNVDLNAFRGTRDEIVKKGWFKDYRPPAPVPPPAEEQGDTLVTKARADVTAAIRKARRARDNATGSAGRRRRLSIAIRALVAARKLLPPR